MKFGMLHLFEAPRGREDKELVDEQLAIMQAAEEYGFDSVWPAEHHFTEYGFCASPSLTLAAIARTTRKVRLCTGVVVLPFYNPVRVAEDYAMLDLLSDGRVELGVGRGYQPVEFDGFGVDQTRSAEMFDEAVEIIQRAWTEERFSFKGDHYQFEDVMVRPKPLQKPRPPMWMAALSESTFPKAGRMGMNLLCSPVFGGSLARSKELIGSYREALAAGEHGENGKEIGALTMVYVGETVEKAREEFAEAVLWYFHHFGKYVAPRLGQPAIKGYEMYTDIRDMAGVVEWEMLLEAGAVICGDADFVCEKIDEVKREHGIGHFLMWTRLGGLQTELVMAHMERMRDHVMPNFR